jgi:hypothetical protein
LRIARQRVTLEEAVRERDVLANGNEPGTERALLHARLGPR